MTVILCGQIGGQSHDGAIVPLANVSGFHCGMLATLKVAVVLCRIATSKVNIMADDPITRHFFHGFIRLHILYHAAKEPIYGAEITEELVRHGYRLSQGTLYPTLHMLEERGYLKSRAEVVAGKQRKYYQATDSGRKVLADARSKLLELVSEVVEDKDEPFHALRRKRGSRPAQTGRRKGRGKKA
jgi:PadR family transcriptional regulator, regulatory protein PadR